MDQLTEKRGAPVYDRDGDPIGGVEEIICDDHTGRPEWIGIGTGFLGTKRVLVPVEGAQHDQDGLRVPYEKSRVKDSPDIDADEIGQATEAELYSYYGLEYSESALPEGNGGRTTDDEASVIRSEEELRVGKRSVEAGGVRLRKWVETEPVEVDVSVRQETARVEREAIDQPVSGVEIGAEEIEVPLRREEAVTQKETVAKERVTIEKGVETEQETVTDEVRKERVDVEGTPEVTGR
jgi:uncharacterized protein (TIGR02271 family)